MEKLARTLYFLVPEELNWATGTGGRNPDLQTDGDKRMDEA